jgi:hypothetical protein
MKRIKNITDVITNSSNEVFIFKSTANPEEVLKDLKDILGPHHDCSGMGGVLEVVSSPNLEGFSYKDAYEGFPEGYLLTNIDYGYIEDLKPYLSEHLGDALEEGEIGTLLRPWYQEKYNKALEEFTSLPVGFEVNDGTIMKFLDWVRLRSDLKWCGGKIDPIDKDRYIKPFIEYFSKRVEDLKKEIDQVSDDDSEEYWNISYNYDYNSSCLKTAKRIYNEED